MGKSKNRKENNKGEKNKLNTFVKKVSLRKSGGKTKSEVSKDKVEKKAVSKTKISKLNIEIPVTSDNIPVTQGMFNGFRSEINSSITSLQLELKSFQKTVDGQFNQVYSKIEKLTGEVHRLAGLIEEQNTKNNIVLDAITAITDRQFRFESEMSERTTRLEEILLASRAQGGL